MACVDIYQALTEDRPYKKGLSHEKTCDILDDMAQKDFIDSDISKIIRECFGTKAPEVCPVCNHPQSYFEVHEENY